MCRAVVSCLLLRNVWCQTVVLLVMHSALLSAECNLASFTELNSWQDNDLYVQGRCMKGLYVFRLNLYMTRQSSCVPRGNVADQLCNYTLARENCTEQSLQWMVNFTSPSRTCLPPRSVRDDSGGSVSLKDLSDEKGHMVDRLAQWHSVLLAARRLEPMVPVFAFRMYPQKEHPSLCTETYNHSVWKGLTANATFTGYSNVMLQERHDSCITFALDLTRDNGCNVTTEMVRVYRNNSLLLHAQGDVTVSVNPVAGNFIYNFSVCFSSPTQSVTAGNYVLALYVAERYVSRHRYIEQTLLHEFTVNVNSRAASTDSVTRSPTTGITTSASQRNPGDPDTQYRIQTQLPDGRANATRVYAPKATGPGTQTTPRSMQQTTSPLPAKRSATSRATLVSTGQAHNTTAEGTAAPKSAPSSLNNTVYIGSGCGLALLAILIALLAYVLRHSWCKSRHLPSKTRKFTGVTSVKKPCNGLQLTAQSTSVSTLLRHQHSPSCSEEPLYVECTGKASPATPTLPAMDADCPDGRRDSTNAYTLEPAGLSRSGSCIHVGLGGKLQPCGDVAKNTDGHPEARYACPTRITQSGATTRVGRAHTVGTTFFSSAIRVRNGIAIPRKAAAGVRTAAPVEEYMHMAQQLSVAASTASTGTACTSHSTQQHYAQPGPVHVQPSPSERHSPGAGRAAALAAAAEDEAGYTSMAAAKHTSACNGRLEAAPVPVEYRNLQSRSHVEQCRSTEPQPSLDYRNLEPRITITITGDNHRRTASNAAQLKCTSAILQNADSKQLQSS